MSKRPLRTTRRLSNLQGRPAWYKIVRNQAAGPARVDIMDEIGFFGVSADSFVQDLAGLEGDIELHMNCPGGDVFDGIAIYNTLKQRSGAVAIVVDGLAASAASFIAQAASPGQLKMAPHSQMMIHDAFGMAIGNAEDMRATAELLDKASDNIASIYAERTGKDAAYWREQMRNETWMSDQETVDAGLADAILGKEGSAEPEWDLSVFAHAPGTGKERPAPGYDIFNADKYSQDDRDRMAKSGEAMEDGSYPIADGEDLDNAIQAVGRGSADHDAIRKHVIKRAAALGQSSKIPDNWNSDGSLKSVDDTATEAVLALFAQELDQLVAGKE